MATVKEKTVRVILGVVLLLASLSAAMADDTDPRYADAMKARQVWIDCAMREGQVQAKKTEKSADLATDAAMAACLDESAAFMKVLRAPPLSMGSQDAANMDDQVRDLIRHDLFDYVNGLRKD